MLKRLLKSRSVPAFLTVLITAIAVLVLADRGGLIAWGTLLMGMALLAKIWLRPSTLDLELSIGLAMVSALMWLGTFYYVISTWESGEVVELARIPEATRLDALSRDETARLLEAMVAKYGDRVGAADVYYLMLGRSRDRLAVVARLIDE